MHVVTLGVYGVAGSVTVRRSTTQCVHMRVKWRSQPAAWLLTVVYGSPQQAQRRSLWQELREIGQNGAGRLEYYWRF